MKNYLFFLMIIILFCSCNKNNTPETGRVSAVLNLRITFAIVDESTNDRLNPESNAYYGDDEIRGLKIFIIKNGVKVEVLPPNDQTSVIIPPYRWYEGINGFIDEGMLGYFCIPFIWGGDVVKEDEHSYEYFYIQYPDASEDVIKAGYSCTKGENGLVLTYDQIWINGELAFERGAWGIKDFYYNTKYYPWLVPVLDDEGNQVGVMPKDGTSIIVITK